MGLTEIVIGVVAFYWIRAYLKNKEELEQEEKEKKGGGK